MNGNSHNAGTIGFVVVEGAHVKCEIRVHVVRNQFQLETHECSLSEFKNGKMEDSMIATRHDQQR